MLFQLYKMIKTHKRTNKRLLLKSSNSLVSTLFVLDENDNKIIDTDSVTKKHTWDINGNPVYKIAICLNENLI